MSSLRGIDIFTHPTSIPPSDTTTLKLQGSQPHKALISFYISDIWLWHTLKTKHGFFGIE